ncbi:hypothetical protein VM1G_03579 [Cytospora mali]|uniref:2,6-dihydropseudooxynicotine hydrolase n=1 Tax=Cytospora mali TaxID=578113 RepID=A0A194VU41_CYTMA|nr:hypothetical protein VM1G_03579 [Valsa mali]
MKLNRVILTSAQLLGAMAQNNVTNETMFPLSTDDEFSFILGEVLSLSNNFGANTGEVLRAASQITPGDFESWYTEFNYLAGQIEAQGDSSSSPVAQMEAYFRAASYYRTAGFFLIHDITDPRIYSLWDSQLEDFAKAIDLLPFPGEKITVQGPNFTIPVYFYLADTYCSPSKKAKGTCVDSTKLPTIVACSGYDGSQEELWHSMGREVTARGWNFVTYEGPGQPAVRRDQGIGFIPNWWDVVTPVIDHLETRDDVDTSKLVLHGQSFGVILTVRAAAVDPRFAAVTLVDGLYNLQEIILEEFPTKLVEYFEAGNETAFNAYTRAIYNSGLAPSDFKWVVDQGLWSFDTDSYYDWLAQLGNYTIEGYAQNLTVPVFVAGGSNDTLVLGQAPVAAAMIGNEATFHLFEAVVGAGEHCQIGAESQLALTMFDWLADVLAGKRVSNATTKH